MSELFVSRLRESEKLTASAAVSLSTVRNRAINLRVISDRNIHINEGDSVTVNDMLVFAFHPVFVSLTAGETLACITATGEIAGSVWLTVLDKA